MLRLAESAGSFADLDVVAATRNGVLPLVAELVHLVYAREHTDVVPEEHVLTPGDAAATGVEDQPGGIAVHAIAVERVDAFFLDTRRNVNIQPVG
jgi:hypothetical protein